MSPTEQWTDVTDAVTSDLSVGSPRGSVDRENWVDDTLGACWP